jgi:ubiquinone/menaquinone biosynthesis C-methylase UbiE
MCAGGCLSEAQPFSVKRAQVEFHNFASLGEPETNLRIYAEENTRRATVMRRHAQFIGDMSPFLEIGANAGHTSYMLTNEFGASGYALDISADSLRHGRHLMEAWGYERAPIRVAGDAVNLPFQDGSLQFVCTFQTLSQFLDMEAVFREVHRVLAPGGAFFFAEEPLLRKLSMRLYRCPYYDTMKPWERRLYDWGLLGYLVRDVIGAHQEESFGIRQNHTMGLSDWDLLARKYFAECRYDAFVPERGWGERVVKRAAMSNDRAARWLGGTLAGILKKAGSRSGSVPMPFEARLRCPDCRTSLALDLDAALYCSCGYRAPNEGDVYNLLPSPERAELYPGTRPDILDFSLPGHEAGLLAGWHELEGVHGNLYRWMSGKGTARLKRVRDGAQRLRIRFHAQPQSVGGEIGVSANGYLLRTMPVDRTGLYILEVDVPDAPEYDVAIEASPTWIADGDGRTLSVTVSMIRLVPQDDRATPRSAT